MFVESHIFHFHFLCLLQGDSGGPLMYVDASTGTQVLAGIVAAGIGCGSKEFPGTPFE